MPSQPVDADPTLSYWKIKSYNDVTGVVDDASKCWRVLMHEHSGYYFVIKYADDGSNKLKFLLSGVEDVKNYGAFTIDGHF